VTGERNTVISIKPVFQRCCGNYDRNSDYAEGRKMKKILITLATSAGR
jgi:uncharacterized Fe-S cluster-containing protein